MTKIGLVSNPRSRRNRSGFAEIEEIVRGRADVVHRQLGADNTEATAILADLAHQQVDVLAINGGDGTVQRLLTALLGKLTLDRLPSIAVLAGGTTNLIAGDVGLPGPPARGLRRLLDVVAGGEFDRCLCKRAVMRIDHLAGLGPQFGLFLAIGALAHAIGDHAVRDARRRLPGPIMLTSTVMRVLADGLKPRHQRRVLRDERIGLGRDGNPVDEARRLLMLVTTLKRLTFGITPYWNQEGAAPLRFTSVAAAPPRLLCASARVLAGGGRALPAEYYESGSAQRLDLGLTSAIALDGEIFAPLPEGLVTVTAPCELLFVKV